MMRSLLLVAAALASCASTTEVPAMNETNTPGAAVAELYDLVTFGSGQTPDWDRVRSLFVDEAVIVLRTGREEMTVFSLDGFVADFVKFIEDADVVTTGFTERILDTREVTFGDIAQVLVKFDSHIPGSDRAPREGLDSFELIRRDERWLIVSIVNERPVGGDRIPGHLFD